MAETPTSKTPEAKKPTEFETKSNEYANICALLGEKEHLIKNARGQIEAWHDQLSTLQKKLVVLQNAEKEIAKKNAVAKEAVESESPLPPEAAPAEASAS